MTKEVFTIWFTGLSGSGKSTLANSLQKEMSLKGMESIVLDGDNIRKTVNKDLGFSMVDREENNRRVAEIAKIVNDSGISVICSLITPSNKMRDDIRKLIGEKKLILVYVKTALEICEARDPKKLYKRAKEGAIKNFTGISSTFEEPNNPDLVLNGGKALNENMKALLTFLNRHYKLELFG